MARAVAPGQTRYDGIDYRLSSVPAGVTVSPCLFAVLAATALANSTTTLTIDCQRQMTVVAGQMTDDIAPSSLAGREAQFQLSHCLTGSPLADVAVQATDPEGFCQS